MKLTARQLQALATELRAIAQGLDDVADAVETPDRPFHYHDHAMTVQLFRLIFD